MQNRSRHGGERYGHQIRLDFSVNINPLGLPEAVKQCLTDHLEELEQYPDQECHELRLAIGRKHGIPAEHILCGNGASELLQLTVRAIHPADALITAPAFSGYETALRSIGVVPQVLTLRREDDFSVTAQLIDALQKRPDMVFLCNPNNPVGNLIEPALLQEAAAFCRQQGIYLLVDECFLEFTGEQQMRSMVHQLAENPYLMVLNAFTKLYAMPGLRLGYLMSSDPALLQRMKAQQPEWSVSVAAQLAGVCALQEKAYVEAACSLLAQEREYCSRKLHAFGFSVYEGCADYLLFESEQELYEPLLQRGILIRHCDNYRGLDTRFYRMAIRRHADNVQLMDAIAEICRK